MVIELTMSDDEQSRSVRVGKKKGGFNWLMIAGGAVVMAVSVAFGRRRILRKGQNMGVISSDDDDETCSVRTYETVPNGTQYWKNNSTSQAEFEFQSHKTKQPAPTDPSPQVTKFCRQRSCNSDLHSNKEPAQSASLTSAALQVGLAARRQVVHRLRQQIRSRDSVIYDMQSQLSDQDQMIAMHRNHSVDLQECVQSITTQLFEANLEVERLHRELMSQRAKPIADWDEERVDIGIKKQWIHPKDVEELVLEARKLKGDVGRLEREKKAKDTLAQARSRLCARLCKKVSMLATELEEVKSAAQGKQRLLAAKEQENFKLANIIYDLRHKFETEDRGNECVRSSKLNKRTDACNTQSSRKTNLDVDRPTTPSPFEEFSSTCKGVVNPNYQQTGSLRKSHGYTRYNDIQQVRVSQCAPECAEQDCRRDGSGDDEKLDERLILKLDLEVDQIACALSATSKLVSEQMHAANRILMDFQEHSWTDDQTLRTVTQTGPPARNSVEFSQRFSCLSIDQKQEVRKEFEQVVRQEDVEREMNVLAKHQTKLRELKTAVAQVTARSNSRNSEDDSSSAEMLRRTSSLFGIEQNVVVQEGVAKETSLLIMQLSTLFPLETPPVQEIWRTVKETSGNRTPVTGPHKHFIKFSDEKSRITLQKLHEHRKSKRQGSSSASRNMSPIRINTERLPLSPMKLRSIPCEFQLGAPSGPRGRTAFRTPATHHENSVGSKRHLLSPSEATSHHTDSFSQDSEATTAFSFGLLAEYRPLENVAKHSAESGQAFEQDDRMSSPDPEANFSEQQFPSGQQSQCRQCQFFKKLQV